MVNLSPDDHQRLISVLKTVPVLADERGRRAVLEGAGLKQFVPMIDLSGPQFLAVNEIVSHLAAYGRVSYDHEALGRLINFIKSETGHENQEFLDRLLIDYQMMTPAAQSPDVEQWHGAVTSADVLEKIIGEDTLRPIAFLAHGLQVARSIGYIGVHHGLKQWSGTGFLLSPDLALTNSHVISSADVLQNMIFRLNYEEDFLGHAQQVTEYKAKANGVFHSSPVEELDYALFQLEGDPGREWGWLTISQRPVQNDDRVNIIQHPKGLPKKISLQNNFVEYVDNRVVQYVTSTDEGSSGSPVLNDAWEVVALHHAGGMIDEPSTRRRYFRNEGIVINKILADLPQEIRHQLGSSSS